MVIIISLTHGYAAQDMRPHVSTKTNSGLQHFIRLIINFIINLLLDANL